MQVSIVPPPDIVQASGPASAGPPRASDSAPAAIVPRNACRKRRPTGRPESPTAAIPPGQTHALVIVAKFRSKYEPIRDALTKQLEEFKKQGNPEEAFYKFLKDVRDDRAKLDSKVLPIVKTSLSDRQLLRNLEYVRVLDEEEGRFKKAPVSFRNSPMTR